MGFLPNKLDKLWYIIVTSRLRHDIRFASFELFREFLAKKLAKMIEHFAANCGMIGVRYCSGFVVVVAIRSFPQ